MGSDMMVLSTRKCSFVFTKLRTEFVILCAHGIGTDFVSLAPRAGKSATFEAVRQTLTEYGALDALIPAVHARLHLLARSARRSVDIGSTLNTTALVNEAYIRLQANANLDLEDRNRFYALCARVMRRILVDYARKRSATKRQVVDDSSQRSEGADLESLLGIDAALESLRTDHPRLAEIIECRFFAGYTQEETADILGLSDRTIRREWLKAKALLVDRLESP